MSQDIATIARKIALKLSPDALRREFVWLMYEHELLYLQDIESRPDVYRQAVADALPSLPADHAEILRLVWQDTEIRLETGWNKEGPPDPELDAEIRRRICALRKTDDEISWYKAIRAPFDDEFAKMIDAIADAMGNGPDVEQRFRELFIVVYERIEAGEYDAYCLERVADMFTEPPAPPSKLFDVMTCDDFEGDNS